MHSRNKWKSSGRKRGTPLNDGAKSEKEDNFSLRLDPKAPSPALMQSSITTKQVVHQMAGE